MADRIQSYKLICSGGLNSNEHHLDLAENKSGAATRLLNYEPSLFGGYRRIEGFTDYDTNFTTVEEGSVGNETSEGAILGLAVYKNEALGNPYVIAVRKDVGATTYSFLYHTPAVGWRKWNTVNTSNTHPQRNMSNSGGTVTKIRHAQINVTDGTSNKSIIVFVDGVNKAIVFDGANWYEIGSGNTGGTSSPGGPNALDAPSLVEFFDAYLFLGGDPTKPAKIAQSDTILSLDTLLTFTAASNSDQYDMGFNVVNFKPFRDANFIFGENSIKKVEVNPDTSATNVFKIESITSNVGCIAPDSIQDLGGQLIYLSAGGLRQVSATSRIGDTELGSISSSIQGRILEIINNEDLDTISSVVVRQKNQYRMFFGDNTGTGAGVLAGIAPEGDGREFEFSDLTGFKMNVATSEFIGKTEYVLHGSFDGRVYQQEKGNTLGGDDIISIYSTPYLDFGETETRKIIHKINTFVRAEGPFTVNLAVQYDWGDPNTLTPAEYQQSSAGAPVVFGGRQITYGGTDIKYGGSSKPVLVTDIQGSGYAARATYVSVGTDAPHSLHGIVFEYGQAGRR